MSHGSDQRLRSDEGMALVAAILLMLLLGVFALSVSVLADLESRLGLNQRAAQQALVLAEAGLEHGRNMLRDAVTPGDFNALIASAATRQLGVPTTGIPLGSGRYWVRVDNDCAAPGGFVGSPAFVPVAVQDDPGGAVFRHRRCERDRGLDGVVRGHRWSRSRDWPSTTAGSLHDRDPVEACLL